MAKTNGTQTVKVIPGRNIILSAGVGKTNLDELKWLADTVLEEVSVWNGEDWAYIADCTRMEPVTPAEGGQLVILTRQFVEAGSRAFAFIDDSSSVMLRIQSHKHTERSGTGIPEGHFETVEEALKWIKEEVNI